MSFQARIARVKPPSNQVVPVVPTRGISVASKDQIKQHLALTSKINFSGVTPAKSEDPRKTKIMQHVKKSLG
ncbi:hypothetical protein C7293_18890 [filamentous cyanobacterium CCT1]|nr:hypothetical protein C7293_18890 [filamentous cyanobacterium CCT1]PSN78912.1 hypothetical protein C8B47_14510 [filamentous cyanobacterium CCP4]